MAKKRIKKIDYTKLKKELDEIAKITALFPCKRDKMLEKLKEKYAHLTNDDELPDQWEGFDKEYEKRY